MSYQENLPRKTQPRYNKRCCFLTQDDEACCNIARYEIALHRDPAEPYGPLNELPDEIWVRVCEDHLHDNDRRRLKE